MINSNDKARITVKKSLIPWVSDEVDTTIVVIAW